MKTSNQASHNLDAAYNSLEDLLWYRRDFLNDPLYHEDRDKKELLYLDETIQQARQHVAAMQARIRNTK